MQLLSYLRSARSLKKHKDCRRELFLLDGMNKPWLCFISLTFCQLSAVGGYADMLDKSGSVHIHAISRNAKK